jgi:hypothetical protein
MKNLYSKIVDSRVRQYLKSHPILPVEDDRAAISHSDYSHPIYSYFGSTDHIWQPIPVRTTTRSASRWIE